MRIAFIQIHERLDKDNMIPVAKGLRELGHLPEVLDYDEWETLDDYGAVVLGHDWSDLSRPVIELANKLRKKSFLLHHEGLYTVEDEWYRGEVPLTDYICAWGPIHEKIFRKRGYKGIIEVTGPPRYDRYHNFKPSITREECYDRLCIFDPSKHLVVFATQFFEQGDVDKLHEAQRQMTEMIARLGMMEKIVPIIKIHPSETDGLQCGFNREELAKSINKDIIILGPAFKEKDLISVEDLIYHAGAWFAYQSSTLFEANFLGTPAACVDLTPEFKHPIDHSELGTAVKISNEAELVKWVDNQAGWKQKSNTNEFTRQFLPGSIDGQNTNRCIGFIHDRLTR